MACLLDNSFGHSGHRWQRLVLWLLDTWDLRAALLLKTAGHSEHGCSLSGSSRFLRVVDKTLPVMVRGE
jgi:hypothetical protein